MCKQPLAHCGTNVSGTYLLGMWDEGERMWVLVCVKMCVWGVSGGEGRGRVEREIECALIEG